MIFDKNGQILTNGAVSIEAGSVTYLEIKIECRNNFSLLAAVTPDLLIEARAFNRESGWTNIETTPIDLSDYAGTLQIFEIRLTAGDVQDITELAFTLSVAAL